MGWAKQARDRAKTLEPLVPKLEIVVDDSVSGLTVSRDDRPLEASTMGVPVPIDPGSYRVAATAPGRHEWSTTVSVGSGQLIILHVPALLEDALQSPERPASNHAERAVPPPSAVRPQPEVSSGSGQRAVGLALGAVALVTAGVGLYFGLNAITDNGDAAARCPTSPACTDPEAIGLNNEAHRAATASTVTFVGAGALLASAAVVYFTSPRRPSPKAFVGVSGSTFVLGGHY
jgi:hypothetical protein